MQRDEKLTARVQGKAGPLSCTEHGQKMKQQTADRGKISADGVALGVAVNL